MKAIVVGGDGLVGAALVEALERRGDIVYPTSRRATERGDRWRRLDLASPDIDARSLPDADVMFLCAAMTRFAECRDEPELAYRTNVLGPAILAEEMARRGCHIVFLSSSVVFDCRVPRVSVDAARSPTSAYGRLKAAAEVRILALKDKATVVRLTKILTAQNPLLQGWLRSLQHGHPVRAFVDHRISPITVDDAVCGLIAIAESGQSGIFHISGAGDISYAEIAREFARYLSVPESLVGSTSAVEAGIPLEEVTAFTSLDPGLMSALTGRPPPAPLDVVVAVMRSLVERDNIETRPAQLAN